MKQVVVSILGLGTVGAQAYQYIVTNQENMKKELQVDVKIGKIFVKNLNKQRAVEVSQEFLTNEPYEALEVADVVLECIGGNGAEMTRELVLWALEHGKSVVMSSKKCLARYGQEITQAANKNQALLRYDATVGGGIPISSALRTMAKCEQITKIYGICNATSNYILDEMAVGQISYEEALQQAQKLGIAENDPTDDVDGYDSLYKAVILCGFGMNQWIDPSSIQPGSIRNMSAQEIDEARKNQSVIKLRFSVSKEAGEVKCEVEPVRVKESDRLARVSGMENIIVVQSSESGERSFQGLGAGAKATASAMFDDLYGVLTAYAIR